MSDKRKIDKAIRGLAGLSCEDWETIKKCVERDFGYKKNVAKKDIVLSLDDIEHIIEGNYSMKQPYDGKLRFDTRSNEKNKLKKRIKTLEKHALQIDAYLKGAFETYPSARLTILGIATLLISVALIGVVIMIFQM